MTALLFGFAMIDNLILLFINMYNVSFSFSFKRHIECIIKQIITLSDLETDLQNVRQCCNKLNQVRIYEHLINIDSISLRHFYQRLYYMLC